MRSTFLITVLMAGLALIAAGNYACRADVGTATILTAAPAAGSQTQAGNTSASFGLISFQIESAAPAAATGLSTASTASGSSIVFRKAIDSNTIALFNMLSSGKAMNIDFQFRSGSGTAADYMQITVKNAVVTGYRIADNAQGSTGSGTFEEITLHYESATCSQSTTTKTLGSYNIEKAASP